MWTNKTYAISSERVGELYIKDLKQLIDSELAKFTSKISHLPLCAKIEYALSHGKRLRPLMVILSAQSVGGNIGDAMPVALAFELLHTATLVHDDILDQDMFRRNALSVHKKWSVNDAILVGDALISLAINLVADFGREILKITSEAGLALCDGEYVDIARTLSETCEDEYFKKIEKKSASLFRAATHSGAIVGGGSPFEIKCLADFGEHFGMAYQLRDDLLDMNSPTDGISKDFRKGRINLPLIYLYESSSSVERERLLNNLRILEKQDKVANNTVKSIMRELEEKGSLRYCTKRIDEHVGKSIEALQPLKDSEYRLCLAEMAKSLK